jgi:hypothetical protein
VDAEVYDIDGFENGAATVAARVDMCARKGFDAVEPDLLDGCRNDTGFPLTAAHQLAFSRTVAGPARRRGPSAGLKNDLGQIPEPVDDFDFAVNEECAEFGEGARLSPFTERGKAVLHAEYALSTGEFCDTSRRRGPSSIRKRPALDAGLRTC